MLKELLIAAAGLLLLFIVFWLGLECKCFDFLVEPANAPIIIGVLMAATSAVLAIEGVYVSVAIGALAGLILFSWPGFWMGGAVAALLCVLCSNTPKGPTLTGACG